MKKYIDQINVNDLKETLDKSSQINRTLGLSFTFFIFYLGIIVASTTDRMLFIPDSGFPIPILDIQLPIIPFYIVSPFIILIFHYNVLFNLQQHSKKLLRLSEQIVSTDKNLYLYPFLFNYAIINLTPILAKTLNLVIRIAIFLLPLGLLLLILIRFADYQNWYVTTWHYFALLIDAALIVTHSNNIIKVIKRRRNDDKENYTFKDLFGFAKSKNHIIQHIKNFFIFIYKIIPALLTICITIIVKVLKSLFSLLLKFKFSDKGVLKQTIHYQVKLFKQLRLEAIIVHFATLYFIFFILIMTMNLIVHLPYNEQKYIDVLLQKTVPLLVLTEENLIRFLPEQEMIQLYQNEEIDDEKIDEIRMEFTKGYDVKNRSFRYANFYSATLISTDFRRADLRGANFTSADLQKTDLRNVNLTNAVLVKTNLRRANLTNTNLQNVDLTESNIQYANFESANLQGAELTGVNMEGIVFKNANLQGIFLWEPNFKDSNLEYVNLQGSDLHRANFQGANLKSAQLNKLELEDASFFEADLSNAQFQGTMLWWANLNRATMKNTKFQGASLDEAYMNGADISHARFHKASLSNTKLLGSNISNTYFVRINGDISHFNGSVLNKAKFQGALLSSSTFLGTYLKDVNFHGAVLNGANFSGAELINVQLQGTCLEYALFQGTDLRNVKLNGAIFNHTDLKGAQFNPNAKDTVLIISDFIENGYSVFNSNFNRSINELKSQIRDSTFRVAFMERILNAKERFDNDENEEIVFPITMTIYKPEDLERDSSFLILRRRIAAKDKEVGCGMLFSTRPVKELRNLRDSTYLLLYRDLYQFIKEKYPTFLEEIWWE